MREAILSEEHEGFRVDVVLDESGDDFCNPRSDGVNAGTLVCWHRRVNLGDVNVAIPQSEEELAALVPKGAFALPVYLYEHSGMSLSTGAFSDPWDSGQVGIIYTTKAKMIEITGRKRMTRAVWESLAKTFLEQEIRFYDAYVRGEVYGYRVFGLNGEELDSCWGFVGEAEYALASGVEVMQSYVKDPKRLLAIEGNGL